MVGKIIGTRPTFFCAPNGANTDTSRKLAKKGEPKSVIAVHFFGLHESLGPLCHTNVESALVLYYNNKKDKRGMAWMGTIICQGCEQEIEQFDDEKVTVLYGTCSECGHS